MDEKRTPPPAPFCNHLFMLPLFTYSCSRYLLRGCYVPGK